MEELCCIRADIARWFIWRTRASWEVSHYCCDSCSLCTRTAASAVCMCACDPCATEQWACFSASVCKNKKRVCTHVLNLHVSLLVYSMCVWLQQMWVFSILCAEAGIDLSVSVKWGEEGEDRCQDRERDGRKSKRRRKKEPKFVQLLRKFSYFSWK